MWKQTVEQQVYLGVDLGAESGRVMAGIFDGQTVNLVEVHRFPNTPVRVAGSWRWDVLRLWYEIQCGLKKAGEQFGSRIVSVGVDTWGVDYVPFNKNDEMLGQPVCYRDHRHDGVMEAAWGRVSRKEIYQRTGLQFLVFNTLYQLIAFQRDQPELVDLCDRILMIPDCLHWLLCGSRVVEYTNATTTQCVNVETGDWDDDLIAKFGLPRKMFPKIVPPGTKLGALREEVAKNAGLSRIDVIAPPTHDTAAAVVGIPTSSTGQGNWAYISSGTWSLVGVETDRPFVNEQAVKFNVTHEGGVDGTYRLLKNVMGLWLVQQCKKQFDADGFDRSYADLVKLAGQAEAYRSLIDPNDGRFLSPENMVDAIQSFCRETKQPKPETPGQLIRCCLESLAFKYADVLKELESLTGFQVKTLHIVGGGSQNELLNQLTADACGIAVEAGPTESTVLGNVLIQARTRGAIGSLGEIREVIRRSSSMKRFEPKVDQATVGAFERWRGLKK